MAWHTWLQIGKLILLAYCLVGAVVLIVMRRRCMRAQWTEYMATDLEVLQEQRQSTHAHPSSVAVPTAPDPGTSLAEAR